MQANYIDSANTECSPSFSHIESPWIDQSNTECELKFDFFSKSSSSSSSSSSSWLPLPLRSPPQFCWKLTKFAPVLSGLTGLTGLTGSTGLSAPQGKPTDHSSITQHHPHKTGQTCSSQVYVNTETEIPSAKNHPPSSFYNIILIITFANILLLHQTSHKILLFYDLTSRKLGLR